MGPYKKLVAQAGLIANPLGLNQEFRKHWNNPDNVFKHAVKLAMLKMRDMSYENRTNLDAFVGLARPAMIKEFNRLVTPPGMDTPPEGFESLEAKGVMYPVVQRPSKANKFTKKSIMHKDLDKYVPHWRQKFSVNIRRAICGTLKSVIKTAIGRRDAFKPTAEQHPMDDAGLKDIIEDMLKYDEFISDVHRPLVVEHRYEYLSQQDRSSFDEKQELCPHGRGYYFRHFGTSISLIPSNHKVKHTIVQNDLSESDYSDDDDDSSESDSSDDDDDSSDDGSSESDSSDEEGQDSEVNSSSDDNEDEHVWPYNW